MRKFFPNRPTFSYFSHVLFNMLSVHERKKNESSKNPSKTPLQLYLANSPSKHNLVYAYKLFTWLPFLTSYNESSEKYLSLRKKIKNKKVNVWYWYWNEKTSVAISDNYWELSVLVLFAKRTSRTYILGGKEGWRRQQVQ